jgi:hypothetical protein
MGEPAESGLFGLLPAFEATLVLEAVINRTVDVDVRQSMRPPECSSLLSSAIIAGRDDRGTSPSRIAARSSGIPHAALVAVLDAAGRTPLPDAWRDALAEPPQPLEQYLHRRAVKVETDKPVDKED